MGGNGTKTKTKMIYLNTTMLVIALNISRFNTPIIRQRLLTVFFKRINYILLEKMHFIKQEKDGLKVKGWNKVYQADFKRRTDWLY